MDQLNDALDKLFTEVDHLDRITETDEWNHDKAQLAVSVAKRVRSASTLAVRQFAALRDQLKSEEDTSNHD